MPQYSLVSVALIGWIPYYRWLAHLTHGMAKTAINEEPARKKKGYDLLFFTGNDTPPMAIFKTTSESLFRNYLTKNDYRGALALWNVVLKVPLAGQAFVDADCLTAHEEIGYTAARIPVLRTKSPVRHMKG